MRQPDTITRLRHMRQAATEALDFVAGRDRGELDTDRGLALILTRLLEIIGEAASGVPKLYRDTHPQIPWRIIIDMRNRLIHAYFDVDGEIVWNTVTLDLVPLIAELDGILAIEDEAHS